MKTTVTGKHIEITDAIKEYAQKTVARLPRYYDLITEIQVACEKVDSHSYEIELIAHSKHAETFVVRKKNDDLYACIDEVADKMERQLTDHKEKQRNHKH